MRRKLKLGAGNVAAGDCNVFGTTIDTAIGLVLVFLLFAILVSTATEVISSVLGLRARALENAIAKLVEDPQTISFAERLWGMFGAHRRTAAADKAPRTLSYEDIYNHALVAGASGNDHPSYVPGANFAAALVQVLGVIGGGTALADVQAGITALPAGDLKTALQTLITQAGTDLDKLRTGIASWFDSAMDRLSGQYKRFTQIITFIVALALAMIFDVDAVHVARTLYAEPALRGTLVAAAEKQVQAGAPAEPSSNAALDNALVDYRSAASDLVTVAPVGWPPPPYVWAWDAFFAGLLGWFLTAIAAMLGAPYWFGILSTLINVRNAGPKPTSSTSDAK